MRVILIDDETNCLEMLTILIQRYCPTLHIIEQFDDPSVAVKKIPSLKPDLVFLDVDMPELNGFDVLDRCKNTPFQVIFTTAHNEYAVKAFKYSAIDYLLKPIDREDLIDAVKKTQDFKFMNHHTQRRDILFSYMSPDKTAREKIALPTSDGILFMNTKDIIFCESEGNYTRVHTHNGHSDLFTKPLKEIEEMLLDNAFYRVHHSFLINLKQVDRYIRTDGGDIQMSNGKIIPVSRQKKQEVLDVLAHL